MTTSTARPLFFLHIRKTVGVSLRGLLANQFPADRILFQAHSVSGPQQPGDALFATGHVDFDYAQRFGSRPVIFTVMREPISRCLSAHEFFQNHDERFFRDLSAELSPAEYESRRRYSDHARRLGMLRFLVEEESLARAWLSNIQTRQLAGASCAGLADDDPRLIETALRHLASIDLTGIVERLDDTLRLLGSMMNWQPLGPLLHLNITPRPNPQDIDPRCIEILRSWNAADLRLYAEARRLFESRLQTMNDRAAEDTLAHAAWPVDGEIFTPDQPIHGYGWHEREQSGPMAVLELSLRRHAEPSLLKTLVLEIPLPVVPCHQRSGAGGSHHHAELGALDAAETAG